MIEALLFVFCVSGLFAWALFKDLWRERRNHRQERRIGTLIQKWKGRPITELTEHIGAPFEVIEGVSGRSLHIWRTPPNRKLPRGSAVLVLTVTVSEMGLVEKGEWQRWGF